ncbi:EI24 domain-containing protein [Pontixanthobacter sp.]|uniref:EI24 domain-containing protein n=1 Tax=Pontixanthobacter sp. TaxID=2792078 RepID=UPI003C7C4427
MTRVIIAIGKAVGQLGDRRIVLVLLKSIAATLAIFAALGSALFLALDYVLADWAASYSEEIGAVIAVFATVIGGWLLFRVVALAVIQFFADTIVAAVEQAHYPDRADKARLIPLGEEIRNAAKGAGRAVGANLLALVIAIPLIFTAIGPAVVFWTVNAWLLGRELQDMVWLRHRHPDGPADAQPPVSGPERFLLGGAIAALLVVPFVNLLAPIIGAASATHLVHRRNGPL